MYHPQGPKEQQPPRGGSPLAAAPVSLHERALARIQREGIIVLDDNVPLLHLTGDICKKLWNLPDEKVVLVEVNNETASREVLVAMLSATLRRRLEDTGHGFAAVISDYNLSYAGEATTIWTDVLAQLPPECRNKCWDSVGRILVSGFIPDEQKPTIHSTGLFDLIVDKPFRVADIRNAVLTSVALHCSDELP